MAKELKKLGANIKELPDGLEITGTGLKGGSVHGYGDHRVVMAMTVAGFAADGKITDDLCHDEILQCRVHIDCVSLSATFCKAVLCLLCVQNSGMKLTPADVFVNLCD